MSLAVEDLPDWLALRSKRRPCDFAWENAAYRERLVDAVNAGIERTFMFPVRFHSMLRWAVFRIRIVERHGRLCAVAIDDARKKIYCGRERKSDSFFRST